MAQVKPSADPPSTGGLRPWEAKTEKWQVKVIDSQGRQKKRDN